MGQWRVFTGHLKRRGTGFDTVPDFCPKRQICRRSCLRDDSEGCSMTCNAMTTGVTSFFPGVSKAVSERANSV